MNLAPVLAFVLAATAPQQIPTLGETMEVSIVNVDVFVTDRKGNRVRGLTKDDFVIYEGTVRRPISNFAEYSSGDVSATVSRAAEAPPPQKRTIVLFLERMRLRTFEAESFVAGIKKTLHALVRPGDAASLVFWSRGSTARIDFTDDLAKIDASLDAVARDLVGAEIDDDQLARQLADETQQFHDEAQEMAAEKGFLIAGGDDSDSAIEIMRLKAMAEMRARVAAIGATISSMAGEEGKKVLLLAPRNLGEIVLPPLVNDPVDPWIKTKYGTEKLVRPLLENANASGVTIYPLYAPGMRTGLPDAASAAPPDPMRDHLRLLNEVVSLEKIAETTGGLLATSVTDIVKLLPRIEDDVTDYYSLAFRGDGGKADRARDIVVKTKNPDYVVRSRRQYVERSDTTRMKDRVAAALTVMPPDGFDITAKTGKIAKSRGRETVPLSIRIPISALTLVPSRGKQAGAFSVFVAAGSDQGAVSEIVQKTQPFELAAKANVRDGYFTYSLDVVVEKRMDRLAVGVLDEVSKEFALLRVSIDGAASP